MKSIFPICKFHVDFRRLFLILFFAAFGFAAGFFIPLRISLALRYDFVVPVIGIFLLLWTAWKLPNPWGEAVSAFFTTLIFSASLAALWRMGLHEIYQVFGLLPWFDGQGYYSEALRLLDGGIFSQISARRPLFPGFFSFLLLLTGRNLRISLLLVSFISSISTWLLAREFKQTESKAAVPAALTTLLFFFYRSFNGAVLTETLGFPLGCLGLALLWNAAQNRKITAALVGLFCMTLALSIRPGAVFSLPLLILWIVFCLKTGTGMIKKFITSSVVVAVGLVINMVMTAFLAPGISASYSNFAQTFYGLVNGGVGWRAIYADHPEFFVTGNENIASQQIYKVSLGIMVAQPEKTLQGAIRAIQAYFSTEDFSAFNFLGSDSSPRHPDIQNAPIEFISRWAANILLVLLVPVTLITRKNPKFTLLLAINLGIIISLPFAPTRDAENMRAYAASICGMAAAVIMVIQYFFHKGKESMNISTPEPVSEYVLSTIIVLAMTVGPLFIHLTAKAPVVPAATCPTGEDTLITRLSPGSTISIGKNSVDPYAIPYARFIENLDQFPDAKVGEALKSIPENSMISQQNNFLDGGNAVWMVAPINLRPEENEISVFCGKWSTNLETDGLFFATHIMP